MSSSSAASDSRMVQSKAYDCAGQSGVQDLDPDHCRDGIWMESGYDPGIGRVDRACRLTPSLVFRMQKKCEVQNENEM